MAEMEAHFDESGTHDDSPFVCVAGYLFQKDNPTALDTAWRGMLQEKGLSFFRMSDCAHGTGPFQGWSKIDRTNLESRAIDLVRTYATHGFAASVVVNDFHLIPNLGLFDSAYSFACLQMFLCVQWWANGNEFHDDAAYIFESGAQHQSEANAFMQKVFNHPQMRIDFRYSSLSWTKPAPVNCSALIFWHGIGSPITEGHRKGKRRNGKISADLLKSELRLTTTTKRESISG